MAVWNPWRGCKKCSEGCRYCYIHKGDAKRGADTSRIVKTPGFYRPLEKTKSGAFRVPPGETVYLCFSSDFLLPEADGWRRECWEMIRQRPDLNFLFLTKRIERFPLCIPPDWGKGYENVAVGCTVEHQVNADARLAVFARLPIRHKIIVCQPLLGRVDVEHYLEDVELVVAGGESDRRARPLRRDWILDLRDQCRRQQVAFSFRQCGTYWITDGKTFCLSRRQSSLLAKEEGLDFCP